VKHLGVNVDWNLKYNKHIDNIVGRARQQAGLLFKCFQTRDAVTLTRAFKVYIRPVLEYASNILVTNTDRLNRLTAYNNSVTGGTFV